VIMGQFICHYAFFYLLTAVQLAVYLFCLRRTWSRCAFAVFALAAYGAQIFSYLQVFVTAGLFISAAVELGWEKRWRQGLSWLLGILIYGALSLMHLFATSQLIPWSEGFRWYMAPYYPLALLGRGDLVTVLDGSWPGYFLLRLYDLFNYHWSLVFHPGIYQPLEWNWVSLPFLLLGGLYLFGIIRHREPEGKRGSETTAENVPPGSPGRAISPGKSLLIAAFSVFMVCLVANALLLLPFGGIRQSIFLAPFLWMGYGGMVRKILSLIPERRRWFKRASVTVLTVLPIVPFALSLPGLYRDRTSRVDLDSFIEAVDRYLPQQILSSPDSIQQLELELRGDGRFRDIGWPGYPHESDVLDADLTVARPYLEFAFRQKRYEVWLTVPENFPRKLDNLIYVDMFLSHDARFEGPELLRFYHPLGRMISPRQRIIALDENPGNAPNALHQSIYWPPNSFYLYRVIAKP
jgi:hypothetical protein